MISIIATIIGIAFLLKSLIRKYFQEMSFLLSIYLLVAVTFGSYIYICASHPDTYSVPRSWSVGFVVWGLYFWIVSNSDKILSKWRIAIGSLFMSLVAGCRPQMLLAMFLAIPIFYDYLVYEKNSKGKKVLYTNLTIFSVQL